MGCFNSKHLEPESRKELKAGLSQAEPLPPRVSAVTFPVKSNVRGVKFLPSAASWSASGKLQTISRVVGVKGLVFTSLFEGLGGIEAAQHLDSVVFPRFSTALERCEGNIPAALKATIEGLEEMLLQAAKASPVKASTGACAVIAVVDLSTNTLHAASVGGCVCLVARTVGSFKQTLSEAGVVADGRKARSSLQGIRGDVRPDGEALEACRAHVLGYGVAKDQAMADGYARVSGTEALKVPGTCPPLHCEVGSQTLHVGDGHVFLLSSGFLDLMAPLSAAALAQQFEPREMQALIDAATAGDREGSTIGIGAERGRTIAHGSASGRQFHGLSPTRVDAGVSGAAAPPEVSQESTKELLANNTVRIKTSEVFNVSDLLAGYALSRFEASRSGTIVLASPLCSDVALVSIAIDFPRSRDSTQMDMMKKLASEAGSTKTSPRAALRWHMIRRFMRFEIQRRKAVRKSWHDIRAALVIQADQHARMAEQVAWQHMQEAVQVTRTGQVMRPGTIPSSSSSSSRKHELSGGGGRTAAPHTPLQDNKNARRTTPQTTPSRNALNAKGGASPGLRQPHRDNGGSPTSTVTKRSSVGGVLTGDQPMTAIAGSASNAPHLAFTLPQVVDPEDIALRNAVAKSPINATSEDVNGESAHDQCIKVPSTLSSNSAIAS